MATVNAINRSRGQSRGGVCAVLRYTMQPEKTVYEGRQLVTGLNCRPECCYTEFISTKLHLQMYLPTIILVLWELVRHLFLQG